MKIKKKICLVGGSGFIGHNLAIELKKRNHEIFVIDSLSVNNLLNFKNKNTNNKNLYLAILESRLNLIEENKIRFYNEDARNYQKMSNIFDEISPDIIIHLAAVSHASESNKDPHTTFDNSLRTLEISLDYVRKKKIHLIYLSSSMVYGNFERPEVNESDNCLPLNIYGTIKLIGEQLIKSYKDNFEFSYTIVRPSALYGERCVSRRVGQIFIENALSSYPITINGNPKERLDFTYIEDFVHGIVLCCENNNSLNETFNITFGKSRSLDDLTKILKTEFPKVQINYSNRDKIMPIRGTLNINKAKKMLDYQPKNNLEIGYKKYIDWYKKFWEKI